jgi:hypothetical protein
MTAEQFCWGTAAAAGLVAAACISALPSATCAALAGTYAIAIFDFGLAAICSIYFAIAVRMRLFETTFFRRYMYLIFAAIPGAMFVLGFVEGFDNTKMAVPFCTVGSSSQLADRQHQKIPLTNVFGMLFGGQ